MALSSGHSAKVLTGEELLRHQKLFKGYTEGLVRLTPDRWLFETPFLKFANKIYNFKFRKDDVVVMTHPKCGTTWVQELVWTMRNNPSLEHPLANTPISTRAPFIEGDTIGFGRSLSKRSPDDPMLAAFYQMCPGADPSEGVCLQMANATSSPRTLKTHLPLSLFSSSLLDTAKVIYVARNPKDMCVSFHHHCRLILGYDFVGSFDQFVQFLVEDDLLQGPFWNHVSEAWDRRNHPNLHFLFYEDLKDDLLSTLTSLSCFLGTNLTQHQLQKIGEYCSIERMRERSSAMQSAHDKSGFFNTEVIKEDGSFFRKGEVGDWKNKLTPEQEEKIRKWTKEKTRHMDISFKYSL